MLGCSFSKPGMSWERASPSRPIAQLRGVVLSPAEAGEPAAPAPRRNPEAAVSQGWLVICGLNPAPFINPGGHMRLLSRNVSLLSLSLAFIISCRDSSGPAAITARFELNNIDGRALPTPPAFTPGLTPTILSSTITLDEAGNAAVTEHRTEWDGRDVTSTSDYTYKITGSHIEIASPPFPPQANCVIPPKGTLFLGRLSLEMGHVNSTAILYNYRLANE